MESELAKRIAEAIEFDCNDRRGLGWDGIDEDTQESIRDSWRDIVASHIAPLEADSEKLKRILQAADVLVELDRLETALAASQAECERLREEALWVRKKLGLPEDATFLGPGHPTLAGTMHVVCSHAHGYETYIVAHKCDDKQGEIARLTVDNAALRKQVEELRKDAERYQWVRENSDEFGDLDWDAIDAALSAQAEACTGEST